MSQVSERIQENGLTIKPSKIKIAFPEVPFIRHIIKRGYVTNDESIVFKILKFEPPRAHTRMTSSLTVDTSLIDIQSYSGHILE